MDIQEHEDLKFDWIVHYRSENAQEDRTSILPIFSIPNAEAALEMALFMLGNREIIGLMRRDLIANADEVMDHFGPVGRLN